MAFLGNILGTTSQFQADNGPDLSGANQQLAGTTQQQQQLNQAYAAQNGLANQSNVFNQQQGLSNQLQGVANGTGPNPAAAMLAQQTGANVANQAALMAGQRGAGANTGLIARQAGQQGAATQQQAIGQGATMQAQQSLGALGQLGQQQANMANLATQQVGQQQAGLAQSNQNALQNQALQGNLLTEQNRVNAGTANSNAQQSGKVAGGILGGVGAALGLAEGGMVPQAMAGARGAYADGGEVSPKSSFGQRLGAGLKVFGNDIAGIETPTTAAPTAKTPTLQKAAQASDYKFNLPQTAAPSLGVNTQFPTPQFAQGGRVPAMVSPGEKYLPPSEVKKVAEGKKSAIDAGEKIPGKAKVKGDSLKNDIVPKTLEAGGIVIPKSIMESKHPHWEAHKFVSAIMKEKGLKK